MKFIVEIKLKGKKPLTKTELFKVLLQSYSGGGINYLKEKKSD